MQENWKTRLLQAVDNDGRSDRAISLAANLGVNFVNELRNTSKEPSIEKVLRLAAELQLSVSYLFLGRDLSKDDEDLLLVLQSLPADAKAGLLGKQAIKSRSIFARISLSNPAQTNSISSSIPKLHHHAYLIPLLDCTPLTRLFIDN